MVASYEPVERVTVTHNGLPIKLIRQIRRNDPPEPYYCISWRTDLPSGRNRQSYRSVRDGSWTIPLDVALDVLGQAEVCGMLGEEYDDLQVRVGGSNNTIIDSRTIEVTDRREIFGSITNEVGEPDWGKKPIFMVIEVPNGAWRKIMIVDSNHEFCTFRSTTTDTQYGRSIVMALAS